MDIKKLGQRDLDCTTNGIDACGDAINRVCTMNFAEICRQYGLRIIAVLVFVGFAEKMQGQTAPGGPGIKQIIIDIYNATNGQYHAEFADQLNVAAAIYKQDTQTQHLTPVGIIADDDFDVNQPVDPPINNDPILYPASLSTTTTNFADFLRLNLLSDNTHHAWLQLNQDFSGVWGVAIPESQDYDAIGLDLGGLNNVPIGSAHEIGHIQGGPNDHSNGQGFPLETSTDDNGTPDNPTDDTYIVVGGNKTYMSAGNAPLSYAAVGTVSAATSTAIPDANGDKWVYYKTNTGNRRVRLNMLQNATPTLDIVANYYTNVRPDRIHNDNSNVPDVAEPAVNLDTANGTFSLNIAGNQLNGTHPILKDVNGSVLETAPDYYLLYIYNSSNTADHANLNPVGIRYFMNGENIDYTQFGDGNPANLSYRIINSTKNVLSDATTLLTPDTTPPVANTLPGIAVLNVSGTATLTFAMIDNGSFDDSGSFTVVAFSPTTANCNDVGNITASYTLADASGNQTSGTETIAVQDNTAPDLTTQNVAGFVDASGNFVANVTNFIQSATDACGVDPNGNSINQTNFSCSDLGVNTIQVTVTDNNGNQTTKPANLTLSDNINPEIPANLAVVGETSASISLNWSAASDNCSVAKYKIYRNGSYRATINAPTTSFTDTGLNSETTYNYTIKSVDGSDNESALSGSVSGTTEVATDTEAPTAPTVAVSDVTDTSFTLTSEGSTDNVGVNATEFYLDETLDGMPNGTLAHTSTASQPVSYEFTGLDANTTYETYSRTTDVAGNASAFSNMEVVQTTVGVEDQEIAGFRMFLNPVSDSFILKIDGQLDDIEIYDATGKRVLEIDPQGLNRIRVSVNFLATGIYNVHVYDRGGNRQVARLVKF